MFVEENSLLLEDMFGNLKQMSMSKLTIKQDNFAQSVADGEFDYPWQSYNKYYDVKKMSKNAQYVETCKLLQNPNVALRISEIRNKTRERNEAKLDEVLDNLAKFLRFNLKSIFKPDGTMKSFDEMTDEEAACIQSFEVVELFSGKGENKRAIGTVKKVKLIDKLGTIDKLMRQMGAYATQPLLQKDDLEGIRDILKSIL